MVDPPKILIADPVDQSAQNILVDEGFEVTNRPDVSPDQLADMIPSYTALMVRSRTQVTADILARGTSLKIVGRAGAGVDNIDVDAATRRGIVVMNTPGGNTVSTAEHTISMMLALARNIPQADKSVRQRKWDKKSFIGTEVSQKTLGLIGLGRVGQEVARRAIGLSMKVIGFDPLVGAETARKLGVELLDLPDIFRRADFISVHTPLTPETRNLFNLETMRQCKKGVRLINCARGGIINENDLVSAIDEGHVAGAALDVYEVEPPENEKLLSHPKIICTPHLGASTEEAQEKVAIQLARQMSDFLKERGMAGVVNGDFLELTMKKELKPYLQLSEKIGKVISQMMEGALESVTVTLGGGLFTEAREVIPPAVLKGLFESLLSSSVNYLNARLVAQERGLSIDVQRGSAPTEFSLVISVAYRTDRETRSITGTIFGQHEPRIIGIDGFHFEMKPEGNLLIYYNIDRPGMLATVSRVLADAGINIAGLALGRMMPGGNALTVISIDQVVPSEIQRKISLLEGVSGVRLLTI